MFVYSFIFKKFNNLIETWETHLQVLCFERPDLMSPEKSFWCCANLNNFLQARYENGRGFLGQVGKRVWKMTGFGLKQGQDLEVEPSTL